MRETESKLAHLMVTLLLIVPGAAHSRELQTEIDELKKSAPKVFIDCRRCDIDYIRTEITFVNYVWDRREADIHVLITTQSTGSGGTEYSTFFSVGLSYSFGSVFSNVVNPRFGGGDGGMIFF